MQHRGPVTPLPSAATPSWRDPAVPHLRIVRWVVVAAAVLTIVASIVTDPGRCTTASPCTADWTFSLVAPLLLASAVLLWRWPVLALTLGLGYAAAAALLDPAWGGRLAAVGYGVLCLALLARLVTTHHRRRAELAAAAAPLTVPAWVAQAARRAGEVPWAFGHLLGAAAGLVVALVGVGLLIGSWSTYQDRLDHAELRSATVVEADPQDPYLVTLAVDGAEPGATRPEVMTMEEYAVGDRLDVRVDPRDPEWAELVAEPWDETWWLSLALLGSLAAAVLGAGAVRRRLGITRLLAGEHRGVEVCAAPVADTDWIGVSHLDDPARRVWAVLDPGLGLDRDDDADREVSQGGTSRHDEHDHPDGARSWDRPTRGVLYGDLRQGGTCALLLDSSVVLATALRERPADVTALADRSPLMPLPTDLEGGDVSEDDMQLVRAEMLAGATHVTPAQTLPQLPVQILRPAWRRALASVQVALGLLAVPLVMLLLPDAALHEVALAAFLGGVALLDGLTQLRPALQLTGDGVEHADGLRSWTIPWGGIRQAMARGEALLLEVDPRSTPPDALDPHSDLVSFESGRLGSAQVAVTTAEQVEALRVAALGREISGASGAEAQRGPLHLAVVALLALHAVVSLVALGIVLGR